MNSLAPCDLTKAHNVRDGEPPEAGRRNRLASALLASVLSVGVSGVMLPLSVSDADAQGLFQRLFNPEGARLRELKAKEELERKKAIKVRVSAPRYFTYKPDRLKSVSLADLSKVNTAAVEAPATDAGTGQETVSELDSASIVLTPFDEARPALKSMSIEALPEVAEGLKAFYREHPNFVWIQDGAPTPKAMEALLALASAADFGLDSTDYQVALPDLMGLAGAERDASVMAFEMQLTSAVMTYILDAERGRVDPNRISGYHDLPRHKPDLVAAMEQIVSAANAQASIEGHQPQSAHFKALKEELAELRAQDQEEDRIVIAPGTFLKPGKTSPEMKNVVAAIEKNGSDGLKLEHAATLDAYQDGEDYTPELVALVKSFQKENGLSADGIVGKNSIRAMVGVTNEAKISKVELAMERSRWLPEELGARKVFINQPAFTATYTAPGEDPLSMRVVVGKKSNQTNFFYDTIEVVEYNPYWGVPYSIIVNEMIPKLAKDPSYLDRSGYEVTTVSGKKVSSASIDWYSVAAKKSSVNVRQYPGRSNALGEVKILFPNRHHIYMHDTPSKSLFKKDMRAFSHGCIRLHDPKAMAAAVLGKSKDYVSTRIGQGQNAQEKVGGDIPVYVSYFTAWPNMDGEIDYFADVYDRDRFLIKALEATDKARG
ncbi:L,D-transpeptidase family protein [Roseibium polysiphoniae]|uniref:L,D-transpeptidase family protein n=1 Tax=Roseibium polysiphoniae TaxID=2571221 RepID=A0ABR9CHU0_9HYPH|nr:L,D-transpeptidase family protein [Roseibium polysiphoniae]MBD8878752.1 L,D-transpeptidase family protein [Roseibium polysiphoniae]